MKLSKTKRKQIAEAQQLSPEVIQAIRADIQRKKRKKFKVVIPADARINPKRVPTTDLQAKIERLKKLPYNPDIWYYPFRYEIEYLTIGKKNRKRKNVIKERVDIRIMAQAEIDAEKVAA